MGSSSNKTDGIQLFDWKSIVNKAHDDDMAWRLYSSNKLAVIIPNVVDNYYKLEHKPKKLTNEMSKCKMLISTCYKNEGAENYGGDFVAFKKTQGYDVHVVSVDDMSMAGSVITAQEVKNYIMNYYSTIK